MIAAALALCLAAGPLAQDDDALPPPWEEAEGEGVERRLFLQGWFGEVLEDGGSGRSGAAYGGEVAWAFDALEVGVSAHAYRQLSRATREWTPVLLLRLTQRFRMRGGVEGSFGFGLGAGRPDGWDGWFQAAVGVRVPLGPLFLGGELAFEQIDLLRLAAGVGVAF